MKSPSQNEFSLVLAVALLVLTYGAVVIASLY